MARKLMRTDGMLHLFAKTQRAHVGPYLFDIRQAFRLEPRDSRVAPSQRLARSSGQIEYCSRDLQLLCIPCLFLLINAHSSSLDLMDVFDFS